MPFLPRRSVDPLTPTSRDRAYPQRHFDLSQTLRSRARSEASLFRRVSTLFAGRRRTPSKTSISQTNASTAGIGYICTLPRNTTFPRVSGDSIGTPQPSLEIRRPSGLGRRASLLESNDSIADSESLGREIQEGLGGNKGPTGYASLPNLLGGKFYSPERPYSHLVLPPVRRMASTLVLPDPIFRAVLAFLPRSDLPAIALVSRGFCSAARYALYHSLDVQMIAESPLEKLYSILASRKELAALVVSFCCHSWPSCELASPDNGVVFVPSDNVCQAFQNMYNLNSLTLPSSASVLSHTSPFTFSLTHLTIVDKKMTQSQLSAIRSWLVAQRSLESLSFPHLVEYTSTDPSFVDDWALYADPFHTNGHVPFVSLLPNLTSLRAPTEIVSALCSATKNPIQHLTLDVRETLYTGLRPSSVIRSLNGVREMHIIFGPEVDKRTVEKFLGMTGSMLTGKDKVDAMKCLEVEVSWKDDDAAETLYGIVTSIISRFRGLETLKLTSPFRSIQAPIPASVSLSLLPSGGAVPSSSSTHPLVSASTSTLRGKAVLKEFVACNVEKNYAKTWTKHCPSLYDIQFDFSCSTTEADVDVELCGVWFRRKMRSTLPSTT